MKKSILIGMTAVALSLGACAKRTPRPSQRCLSSKPRR